MTKMHEHELRIDLSLVQGLLKEQCPQWAHLPLLPIQSSGTDHALFRLGNAYVVRLPRIHWAVANIDKEYDLVPKISEALTLPLSKPLFKGKSTSFYPWPWLINQWNEGHNPPFEHKNEYAQLAKDLAHFLNHLQQIPLLSGPISRRGVALNEVNLETQQAMHALTEDIDVPLVASLWEQLVAVPFWNKSPMWVHGDFLPGNILIKHKRLSAVIDFSDVGMGDPACDLIIAWSLFNSSSRKLFKENLKYIDNNTWSRGRGWALSIALIMLPYYKHSNPFLTALARRIISQVVYQPD